MNLYEKRDHIVKVLPGITNHIKGMPSNSASPSETFFLDFKKRITYKDEPIQNGFLKLFVTNEYILRVLKGSEHPIKNSVFGLNYEIDIYQNVISPMVDNNICINFVTFLGSSKDFSYSRLLKFLKQNQPEEIQNNLEQRLNYNIYSCLIQSCNERKSINDYNFTKEYNKYVVGTSTNFMRFNVETCRFSAILTKTVKNYKFANFLRQFSITKDQSELYNVLFQIAVGCYALSLSKTMHNDLHHENIFIEESPVENIYVYVINKKTYIIKSRYKALIYDFDRAYNQLYGNNEILTPKQCKNTFRCNKFTKNYDIIKLICHAINNIKDPEVKEYLLKTTTENSTLLKNFQTSFNDSGCFFEFFSGLDSEYIFSDCRSGVEIIKRFYIKTVNTTNSDLEIDISTIPLKNISICDENLFNNDGSFVTSYEEIMKNSIKELQKTKIKDFTEDIFSNDVTNTEYSEKNKVGITEIDSGENIIFNKKLYKQLVKDAKEKFKVWPSKYADNWINKEYKKRGGFYIYKKSRKPIRKTTVKKASRRINGIKPIKRSVVKKTIRRSNSRKTRVKKVTRRSNSRKPINRSVVKKIIRRANSRKTRVKKLTRRVNSRKPINRSVVKKTIRLTKSVRRLSK